MSILGIAFLRKDKERLTFLITLFALFFTFFTFYWAGNINILAISRFSLIMIVPVVLLAGFGCYKLKEEIKDSKTRKLVTSLLLICFLVTFTLYIPLLQDSFKYTKEYELVKNGKGIIDKDCQIATFGQSIITVVGEMDVFSISDEYTDETIKGLLEEDKCVIYYKNYWCYAERKLDLEYNTKYYCDVLEQKYLIEPIITAIVDGKEGGFTG